MTPAASLRLSSPFGVARVDPFGAQVLSWVPQGHKPVLWASSVPRLDGRPLRGGIPVCLPWFGSPAFTAADVHDVQYSHGFARLATWEVRDTSPERVLFSLSHTPTQHEGVFPYCFTAHLEAQVSDHALTLSLHMRNDDDHPFTFEEALHTYVAVSDIRTVTLTGLEGQSYVDTSDGLTHLHDAPLHFTGPTDRIYHSSGPLSLTDPSWDRKVTITTDGGGSTIVWTPWSQGASALSDMETEDWPRFVCIESGNVRTHAPTVFPGDTHVLSVSLDAHTL